jgi:hypothetical protein
MKVGIGPSRPSSPSAEHGSYRGESCHADAIYLSGPVREGAPHVLDFSIRERRPPRQKFPIRALLHS